MGVLPEFMLFPITNRNEIVKKMMNEQNIKRIKYSIIILLCVLVIWLCFNENSRLAIKHFFRQLIKSIF